MDLRTAKLDDQRYSSRQQATLYRTSCLHEVSTDIRSHAQLQNLFFAGCFMFNFLFYRNLGEFLPWT